MLKRITYSSVRPSGLTDNEVIRLIAIPSRARNATAGREEGGGVTSCLWFGPGRFLQVLEGEESVLDPLMTRIRNDPRHNDVHILTRSSAVLRLFDGWPLKLVGPAQCPMAADLAAELRGVEGAEQRTGEDGHAGEDLSAHIVVRRGPMVSVTARHTDDDGRPTSAGRSDRAKKAVEMLSDLVTAAPIIYP